MRIVLLSLLLLVFIVSLPVTAQADEVTDWNAHLFSALITANVVGLAPTRPAAIVHSAILDAVNGIEQRSENNFAFA